MPYRPRIEHDLLLDGQVAAFEVRLGDEDVSRLSMRLELRGHRGLELLASREFEVEAPLAGTGSQQIAQAAGVAVEKGVAEVSQWVVEQSAARPGS
jgi:cholesterol transport system auxiliary component